MGIALDFRAVQAVEDLAGVGGQGGEDFGAGAAHGHEADGGFGVGLCFAVEDEVGGVGLRVPAGGDVVAVTAGLAVVDAGVVSVTFEGFGGGGGGDAYTIIVASNTILAVLGEEVGFGAHVRESWGGELDGRLFLERLKGGSG